MLGAHLKETARHPHCTIFWSNSTSLCSTTLSVAVSTTTSPVQDMLAVHTEKMPVFTSITLLEKLSHYHDRACWTKCHSIMDCEVLDATSKLWTSSLLFTDNHHLERCSTKPAEFSLLATFEWPTMGLSLAPRLRNWHPTNLHVI